MTTVAVVGCGATGSRAARHLAASGQVTAVELSGGRGAAALASSIEVGRSATPTEAEVVVLAGPSGTQAAEAAAQIDAGRHVVSTTDDSAEVETMLGLDDEARSLGRSVVVGAAFCPGFSDLLASWGADSFDELAEIHVARFGTGGPACARAHHGALRGRTRTWRDGDWADQPSGSGRELAVFPAPVDGADCYRAAVPVPRLLQARFPGVERISIRQAANRRDRLTSWLPMLRRPHPEGLLGAVRVELRGVRDGAWTTRVLGALDRPAVAAGAVAAVAAEAVITGAAPAGVTGVAGLVEPAVRLRRLAELGVRGAEFTGAR